MPLLSLSSDIRRPVQFLPSIMGRQIVRSEKFLPVISVDGSWKTAAPHEEGARECES